ncbi:hypothetical protein MO973_35105 [Paenibacillus sp. TRM 82003]|nr:hypothetical protein [Paenibacillus sp. TRM 82003]
MVPGIAVLPAVTVTALLDEVALAGVHAVAFCRLSAAVCNADNFELTDW